jgi:hypothetical protein
MSWEIRIPFRRHDDLVLDAITAVRETMNDSEQRVVEVLARDALQRGVTSVGGLLDELEQLNPTERRRVLDQARARAGLDSTGEVDRRRQDQIVERRFQEFDIPDPPSWSEWQVCPAKGCRAFPHEDGRPVLTHLQRWWCEQHRHLAPEADLQPWEPPYVGVTHTGKPIPSAKEKARIAAEVRKRDEPREREREQREEMRARENEAIDKVREGYAREGEISVAGVRVHPDMRVVQP